MFTDSRQYRAANAAVFIQVFFNMLILKFIYLVASCIVLWLQNVLSCYVAHVLGAHNLKKRANIPQKKHTAIKFWNYCKNHTYSLLIADSSECAFISREKKAIFVVKLEKNDNRHNTEDHESAWRKGGVYLISVRSVSVNKIQTSDKKLSFWLHVWQQGQNYGLEV